MTFAEWPRVRTQPPTLRSAPAGRIASSERKPLSEPVPFDASAARAYGRVYAAAVVNAGRKARGQRALDLLIAATALAAGVPLYTRNPSDFVGLGLEIVAVPPVLTNAPHFQFYTARRGFSKPLVVPHNRPRRRPEPT